MQAHILLCSVLFCLSVTIVFTLPHNGTLKNGDECYHEKRKSNGFCLSLKDCPSAVRDLKEHKIDAQTCGFEGNLPIVCCVRKLYLPGEISKKKCLEYGKLVERELDIPTFNIDKQTINESECAIRPTFVHGGQNAIPKEFPHMALLGFGDRDDKKWRCGGSLISEKYILTAAHCLFNRNFGQVLYAHLGDLDITSSTDDADPQDFDIINRFRHPDYKHTSNYNDIGLVELDQSVDYTDYVRPACLHVPDESSFNGYFTVTGWGHLEHDVKAISPILQKAVIQEFTNKECSEKFQAYIGSRLINGVVDSRQICAGGKTNDRDTCAGDSGGPLQISHPNVFCMYSIVGVTSFGLPRCGLTGIPAIYTRVSNYIEWIENVVWPS